VEAVHKKTRAPFRGDSCKSEEKARFVQAPAAGALSVYAEAIASVESHPGESCIGVESDLARGILVEGSVSSPTHPARPRASLASVPDQVKIGDLPAQAMLGIYVLGSAERTEIGWPIRWEVNAG
jgi:hypothetical protein